MTTMSQTNGAIPGGRMLTSELTNSYIPPTQLPVDRRKSQNPAMMRLNQSEDASSYQHQSFVSGRYLSNNVAGIQGDNILEALD